jgi:hypothetical protein
MRHLSRILAQSAALSVALSAALILTACGPTTFTKIRTDWQPVDAGGSRQQVDDVVVDITTPTELPSEFYADAQKCEDGDSLIYTSKGQPVLEKVLLAQPYQMWRKVAITNQTANVLRLNNAAIRLFTPDGREWEPLTKDAVLLDFKKSRICPSTETALNTFRGLRMVEPTTQIIPGATSTAWLAFNPPSADQAPGIWKLGFYDVPVKMTEAGTVARSARFEFRFTAIKYIDTYRQVNLLATPKLISTEVVGN